MKKEVFEINENGLVVEKYVVEVDENGNPIDILEENIITTDMPHGLYKPKWNGIEWAEDATQEYIDDLINRKPTPSETEVLKQELANTNAMILELTELILGGM